MSAPARFRVVLPGESVRVEARADGVHRLVLARPAVRNAFDEATIDELGRALERLAAMEPEGLRLLVLTGDGPVFCAGADLRYMERLSGRSLEESLDDARRLAALFYRLADFPAPVLAAVRGAAIGGGLGLVVCADEVVAEEGTRFATSEVRLGIVPGVIAPYLVRRLGLGAVSALMLSGRRIDAEEAHRLGLVHRLAPAGGLDDAVEEAARDYLAGGPEAVRRTKALLKRTAPLPAEELVEATARAIAEARCSAEGRAGLAAFFAKTPPPWRPKGGGPDGGR